MYCFFWVYTMRKHGEFKVSSVERKNILIDYLTKKYGKIKIQNQNVTPDGNMFLHITYCVRGDIFEGCSY